MICVSAAQYPNYTHLQSLQALLAEQSLGQLHETGLGALCMNHMQLVPQNRGRIDQALIEQLQGLSPSTQFRLHANVHVCERHVFLDLSDFHTDQTGYFGELARINRAMGSPDYSLHSGKATCTLSRLFDNANRLGDLMGCRVAIEGQYPSVRGSQKLISSWAQYEVLLKSGCFMAIDLSHLNIVRAKEGARDDLVIELLKSPKTIEVHLSANDGHGDQHQCVQSSQWWESMLSHVHFDCVVFTEGNRRISVSPSV